MPLEAGHASLGPDDKITDMSGFYDDLVKAITDAHKEGEEEDEK